MPESNKFAVRQHGKKYRPARPLLRIAPFEGGGNDEILLRGFRCDHSLVQAALAAVRHIAMNDAALGCLVESGGETVEFDLGRCRVTAGDDGAKLLLA